MESRDGLAPLEGRLERFRALVTEGNIVDAEIARRAGLHTEEEAAAFRAVTAECPTPAAATYLKAVNTQPLDTFWETPLSVAAMTFEQAMGVYTSDVDRNAVFLFYVTHAARAGDAGACFRTMVQAVRFVSASARLSRSEQVLTLTGFAMMTLVREEATAALRTLVVGAKPVFVDHDTPFMKRVTMTDAVIEPVLLECVYAHNDRAFIATLSLIRVSRRVDAHMRLLFRLLVDGPDTNHETCQWLVNLAVPILAAATAQTPGGTPHLSRTMQQYCFALFAPSPMTSALSTLDTTAVRAALLEAATFIDGTVPGLWGDAVGVDVLAAGAFDLAAALVQKDEHAAAMKERWVVTADFDRAADLPTLAAWLRRFAPSSPVPREVVAATDVKFPTLSTSASTEVRSDVSAAFGMALRGWKHATIETYLESRVFGPATPLELLTFLRDSTVTRNTAATTHAMLLWAHYSTERVRWECVDLSNKEVAVALGVLLRAVIGDRGYMPELGYFTWATFFPFDAKMDHSRHPYSGKQSSFDIFVTLACGGAEYLTETHVRNLVWFFGAVVGTQEVIGSLVATIGTRSHGSDRAEIDVVLVDAVAQGSLVVESPLVLAVAADMARLPMFAATLAAMN